MASITAQDGLDMQTNSGYQYFLRDRRPDVPANNAATPRAPAISEETLLRRRAFRDSMQRETCEHRLVHSHERAGRSILQVLSDRARWGSSHVVWPPCRAAASASLSARKGSESPSTVCDMSPTEKQRPATLATAPCSISAEIALFAEQTAAVRYAASFLGHLGGDDELQHGQRPASSRAVSTISVAFSPDAATMASTHGDHSVKISCCATGRLLQTLHGHPRTPWTVKYHPNNSQIVASGCLGHQVRVWNWVSKQCLQMVRLEYAIISLSFHPSGQLLAVANGTRLHFWGVDDYEDGNTSNNTSEGQITTPPTQQRQQPTRSQLLTEMDQRHMLRCVHFPPNGRSIIIGGVNPYNDDASARRRNRPTMSFYLRLWDFELSKALCLDPTTQDTVMAASIHGSPAGVGIVKRAISQPRTFLPRALLYNDGGFDVSPDGKTLCACAEYWLPDGIDNAMELVRQEEHLYGSDATEEDRMDVDDDDHHTLEEEMDHKEGFDTRSAVTAALTRLRGIAGETTEHRSRTSSPYNGSQAPALPLTPPASTTHVQMLDYVPQTPPYLTTQGRNANMSPPSPPGRRSQRVFGHHRSHADTNTTDVAVESENRGFSTPPPPPPPPVPPAPPAFRTPHPLCIVSKSGVFPDCKGRYVPHVVTISLDTDPIPEGIDQRGKQYGAVADGYRPRLGQLIEACPLDTNKASAVTCVKFSPSTDFCLIGFGVREPLMDTVGAGGLNNYHPVTSLYRIKGGMTHVSTMLSGDDDVNIARFHPDVGYGFVYGTKQGRVRILSPRPWNYYHC